MQESIRQTTLLGKPKVFLLIFYSALRNTFYLGKKMYLDHIFSFLWERRDLKQFSTTLKYIFHLLFQFPLDFFYLWNYVHERDVLSRVKKVPLQGPSPAWSPHLPMPQDHVFSLSQHFKNNLDCLFPLIFTTRTDKCKQITTNSHSQNCLFTIFCNFKGSFKGVGI